jgi:outer membrane lipoprotein-sorting protein
MSKSKVVVAMLSVLSSLALAGAAEAKTAEEIDAAGSAEQKGQAVAQELAARNTGYKDLGGDVEMTLKDASGGEAKRRFNLKVLEKPDAQSGDYSLIVFDAPADVKGTAVLSHARPGDEDEQWLYLPSARRVKRISSSNRTGAFVGSEFSFEDLTGNDGRKYTWKLVGKEPCGGAPCLTVEATPKDPQSAYSKRVMHVDAQEFRIQSIEFFDRKGAKQKTLTYDNYKKMNGRFWRAQTWSMQNHQSGKSTVVSFSSMRLGNGYSASDFSTGKLGG